LKVKPWKLLSSIKEKSYRIFDLRVDRAVSPRTGEEHDFYVFESHEWVNIIPVTKEREVVLIRQYRHGVRDVVMEIPGGIVEPGDTPLDAAIRELKEETGYTAKQMVYLGLTHANPAFMNNRCYSYLALDCEPSGPQNLDDKEDIEVLLRPLDDIPRMIRDGVDKPTPLTLRHFTAIIWSIREGVNSRPPSCL
jgi:8-oxo-dGTP pyrophosphatase MutT (NUDIX family)